MDRAAYANLKKLGICVTCARRDADAGVRCQRCVDMAAQRRHSRLTRALCPRCGSRPPVADGACCEPCNRRDRRNAKNRRRRLAAQAVCLICAGDIEFHREGYVTCQRCGDRKAENKRLRRERASGGQC